MSNVTAMECTKDLISVTGADGRTWSVTRTEIMAIYDTKTGNAASRKAQTITDVLAAMEVVLGADQAAAALATLDFNPTNANASLQLGLI